MDLVGNIMAYEQGDLSEQESVELFQHLIDTGQAWTLQGSYGRTAAALIEAGVCTDPRNQNEVCSVCKQDDNCGDCNHHRPEC